jgi:uncharacterized protein involved in type VI secretion and phage assembly
MVIPFNPARMHLTLQGGERYPILALQGDERLNRGFYFQVDLQVPFERQAGDLVGGLVQLHLLGLDGGTREIGGLVECVLDCGLDSQGTKRMILAVVPRLRVLEQVRGPALWLGLDFRGLVRALVDEAGLTHACELRFDFNGEHAPRLWTLRAPGRAAPR